MDWAIGLTFGVLEELILGMCTDVIEPVRT